MAGASDPVSENTHPSDRPRGHDKGGEQPDMPQKGGDDIGIPQP